MNISAKITFWIALVFGLFCLGYAITASVSLDNIADAKERAEAQGYVWFWLFLAGIAFVFGTLSWFMAKGKFGNSGEE